MSSVPLPATEWRVDDDIIANGLELLEHRKQLLQSMSSANTRAADRAAAVAEAAWGSFAARRAARAAAPPIPFAAL